MPSVAEASVEGPTGAEQQAENGNCNNRAFDEYIYIHFSKPRQDLCTTARTSDQAWQTICNRSDPRYM